MTAMNLRRSFRPFESDSDGDANAVPAQVSDFKPSWLATVVSAKIRRGAFGLGSPRNN